MLITMCPPQTSKKYFNEIEKFAFYDALDAACQKNEGKGIKQLIADGNYKAVAANMLKAEGLNYGQLPKGLLLFHKYPEGPRTPMEEHLVEGALYAASNGEAHVHFTVSHEHMELFKAKVAEKADSFAKKYGIKYDISFSERSLQLIPLPLIQTTHRSATMTAHCYSAQVVTVHLSRTSMRSTLTSSSLRILTMSFPIV